MSLIDAMMEDFVYVNKSKTEDPEGGTITEWIEGATFRAVAVLDTSMQARIAEREGVTNVYTITTSKNVELEYHEVIKRLKDGKIFRITSDGSDNASPNVSTLDIRQVTAEKWELTK